MMREKAIGLFDSGVGGLTVLNALQKKLPNESFIYFGDTARVPYGNKAAQTVQRYSLENAAFLEQKEIKFLVVACNTASAFAIDHLQAACQIPVLGVIEAGVQGVVQLAKKQRIAVLGTQGTIASKVYEQKIKHYLPKAKVLSIACPLLVPLVEENFLSHPATRLIVQEYLKPLTAFNADALILGCTHYPLLASLIQQEVGPAVQIIDSATCCADLVANRLTQLDLHRSHLGRVQRTYYVTDDCEKFCKLACVVLGDSLQLLVSQTVVVS